MFEMWTEGIHTVRRSIRTRKPTEVVYRSCVKGYIFTLLCAIYPEGFYLTYNTCIYVCCHGCSCTSPSKGRFYEALHTVVLRHSQFPPWKVICHMHYWMCRPSKKVALVGLHKHREGTVLGITRVWCSVLQCVRLGIQVGQCLK